MRLGQRAGVTDAGRKRRRNEDAFVVDPPLFVVADGMGGAQAGEVASRLAAAAFREYHDADELAGDERVRAIIQEANRRIYERAQVDTNASGMGTTVTAAIVEGGRVAIGHVGDSRAYRIRAGALEQLTDDHSLVADLMRSGRLTAEEADTHPQRSVITRALGTDPEVDVDTFTVAAEPGDVFLLCSDGLTTMVGDDEILRLVAESSGLESAAKALVKAANRHGGEDNVTVVLFAVEAGEAAESAALEETARLTADGHGDPADLEDTLSGLEPPVGGGQGAAGAGAGASTAVAEPDPEPERAGERGWEPLDAAASARDAKPRRRWGRRLLLALGTVALVAVLLAIAFWGLANAHFVGAEDDGRVAVYQGLPYDVGGGVALYRARYVSRLLAAQLSHAERLELFDHDLMSYGSARARVSAFELELPQ
jgi:serine/threonine protein phosphatase PrpC